MHTKGNVIICVLLCTAYIYIYMYVYIYINTCGQLIYMKRYSQDSNSHDPRSLLSLKSKKYGFIWFQYIQYVSGCIAVISTSYTRW